MLIDDRIKTEMKELEDFHFGATQSEMIEGLSFYFEEYYPKLILNKNEFIFNIDDLTFVKSQSMIDQLNLFYPESLI